MEEEEEEENVEKEELEKKDEADDDDEVEEKVEEEEEEEKDGADNDNDDDEEEKKKGEEGNDDNEEYVKKGESRPTTVELKMLTGLRAFTPDVERISKLTGIRDAVYSSRNATLNVKFDKIAHDESTCFALRAVDDRNLRTKAPVTIVIREAGRPQPSCVLEYESPETGLFQQVFCADIVHGNRGECRCFSGSCSSCRPIPHVYPNLTYAAVKKQVCNSKVVYELKLNYSESKNHWTEINATVVHRNKTGSHVVNPGDTIKLITPSKCFCPHSYYTPERLADDDRIYMLSPDVEKIVDKTGQAVYVILSNSSVGFGVSLLIALDRGDTISNELAFYQSIALCIIVHRHKK
ncbi:LOW QUALITY PROTEIN: hypothetical protein PoB_000624400 [Plakobranchus ocellatus]|uniref:Alpha-macroglobulin receptor-binding domain-containing protein n=1 Tax=Plakobranchus ocellatus TaxID=259542 RepID=A0AAV3Y9V6_9GAST|nr:LOW QUALITY PROTEIN: hypothetical protein PoB_000624400 [Plakobranchus ocellatus]